MRLRLLLSAPFAAPLALLSGGSLPAQQRATVPAVAATLPGNAAVSMPLRWSQGSLQVAIGPALLPQGFVGRQITGVRLRRPAFLGEPPYAGALRTITVRAGFTTMVPFAFNPDRVSNVPAGAVVVAGPTVFPVGASAPPSGTDPLGAELLVIPFTTPLTVGAGTLFLEFETTDAPLAIDEPWVDAVWFPGGVDRGLAVAVGNGACTLGSAPLQLAWTGGAGPVRGAEARLRLTGTPLLDPAGNGVLTIAWVGVEPQSRPIGLGYLGFGGAAAQIDPTLVGCFQWAPIDVQFFGASDAAGGYDVRFAVPTAGTTVGMRLGVQAAWIDPRRAGLPFSLSNGVVLVLDSAAVNNNCSSLYFPGTTAVSPWGLQVGLMPVLTFDYQ